MRFKIPQERKMWAGRGWGRGDDVWVIFLKPGDRSTRFMAPFTLVCLKFLIIIKEKFCVSINDKLTGETDTDFFLLLVGWTFRTGKLLWRRTKCRKERRKRGRAWKRVFSMTPSYT